MLVIRIVNNNPTIWNCCQMCSNLLNKYKIKLLKMNIN